MANQIHGICKSDSKLILILFLGVFTEGVSKQSNEFECHHGEYHGKQTDYSSCLLNAPICHNVEYDGNQTDYNSCLLNAPVYPKFGAESDK